MTTASRRRFIVTVDDPGGLIQDRALFDRARRFFDEEQVPASFMVVPRGEGGWRLDLQTEWLAALKSAEADGHDCQLHGLDHKDCEFGPYPRMICALHDGDAEGELRRDTQRHGHNWRRELYVEKLDTAMAIYQEAFGRPPLVFRTGALSQTPDLYEVMAEAGLRYASNSVLDPRGWAYIIENYEDPGDWDPEVPPQPHYVNERVVNIPITSEYAWYLTSEKIEPHLALAIDDLHRVFEADAPFVLVCHVQCVGAEDGLSQQLLHRLLEAARTEHAVTFGTLAGLVDEIESGEVPVVAPAAQG